MTEMFVNIWVTHDEVMQAPLHTFVQHLTEPGP
jgi:hypothetical protein